MNSIKNRQSIRFALLGIAIASPIWAVSLPAPEPAAVPHDQAVAPASLIPARNPTPGSASLVPLMVAEMEANHVSYVDAAANGGGGDVASPDDIAFVKQATEGGRKEINSARDALPQLKQPELKRIAEMLVSDHTGANVRLSKLAEAKGWPLPAPQPFAPPPSGTASSDFDASWTAEMIAGHERSAALYRAQAQNGEDKDLRNYARETLPTIERHLADLRRLQK
jgi:predicted outer membrane protein